VTLDGQVVRNNVEALLRIGYVPDGDGLYEEQTARASWSTRRGCADSGRPTARSAPRRC
jgi:ABC-type multidrug transport system ATPase subunit